MTGKEPPFGTGGSLFTKLSAGSGPKSSLVQKPLPDRNPPKRRRPSKHCACPYPWGSPDAKGNALGRIEVNLVYIPTLLKREKSSIP